MSSSVIIQNVDHAERWAFLLPDGTPRDISTATFEWSIQNRSGETLLDVASAEADVTVVAPGTAERTITAAGANLLTPGYVRQQLTAIIGGVRYSLGPQEIEIKDGF